MAYSVNTVSRESIGDEEMEQFVTSKKSIVMVLIALGVVAVGIGLALAPVIWAEQVQNLFQDRSFLKAIYKLKVIPLAIVKPWILYVLGAVVALIGVVMFWVGDNKFCRKTGEKLKHFSFYFEGGDSQKNNDMLVEAFEKKKFNDVLKMPLISSSNTTYESLCLSVDIAEKNRSIANVEARYNASEENMLFRLEAVYDDPKLVQEIFDMCTELEKREAEIPDEDDE